MIETREALTALDDILSVPGLDGIYVGPSDLSASLGYPPALDPEQPEVVEAISTILKGAKMRGPGRRPAHRRPGLRQADARPGLRLRLDRLGFPAHGDAEPSRDRRRARWTGGAAAQDILSPIMRDRLNVGLIGSGFIGRAHAFAWRAASAVFDLPVSPACALLAEVDAGQAETAARRLGFARATGDWRELIADPEIDLVDITTPNALHEPMALAAIEAGKPVYCEKPLAPTAEAAARMVRGGGGQERADLRRLQLPLEPDDPRSRAISCTGARSARSGRSAASTPRTT